MNFKENLEKLFEFISKNKKILLIVGVSLIVLISIILLFLSVATTILISFIVFASSFLFLIYFSVDYTKFVEIRKAERSYPDFLEDLAEAKSSGMTIAQAVNSCNRGQYGALMPYIQKLNIRISWGMPFNQAWMKFSEDVKNSRIMARFNMIILEAIKAGADTASILASLATRAGTIRSIEDTRKNVMRQQVAMMYVIYIGFIGIIILLKKILLPTLYIQNIGSQGFSEMMASGGGGVLTAAYFKQLFMLIILAQSISSGVLIGQILEDKLIGGIKHIAILLGLGFVIYFMFIYPVSIETNQFISNNQPYRGEEINIGGTISIDGSPASSVVINIEIDNFKNISATTGSQGRYYEKLNAPAEPGNYPVITTIVHEGKTKIIKDFINVQ